MVPVSTRAKRDREPAEIGAMSRRVFRALVRRAGDGDIEALRELVALQDQLRDAITDAGRAMHDDAGFSFTYLAAETGVTRQAARKRYGRDHCPECGINHLGRCPDGGRQLGAGHVLAEGHDRDSCEQCAATVGSAS